MMQRWIPLAASLAVLGLTQNVVAAEGAVKPVLVQSLSTVPSGRYEAEPDHTRVTWRVLHHGFSNFQAVLPKIRGTLQLDSKQMQNSRVDVEIDMTAASSGIPVFDQRLADPEWKLFSSRTYPTARFVSRSVQPVDATHFRVTGDLTFLGVTRPITLEATFNQAGTGLGQPPSYRIGFDATAVLNRPDWGLTSVPTVSMAVQLAIEAEFLKAD